MIQTRVRHERNTRFYWITSLAAPIVIFGAIFGADFLFLLGLLLFAITLTVFFYLSYVHKPVDMEIEWNLHRLFPGEKATLSLQLKNNGNLPIQGKWSFKLQNKLELDAFGYPGEVHNQYESTFTLHKQEAISYKFEAVAKKRGIVQLHELITDFNDPFILGSVKKEFILPRDELLIYPKVVPVVGVDQLERTPMGERSVNRFTHEDPTYIVGARTYQNGDPFQRIDWKTTARKQELHTKLLDRTAHTELVVVGNVRSQEERWMGMNEELIERAISAVASICHHAAVKSIPYQVLLNMRPMNQKAVYQIKTGEGPKHLSYTLENLAQVNIFSTLSFEGAVYHGYQNYTEGKIFILITPYLSDSLNTLIERMAREGIPLYIIQTEKEGFVLQKVGREMKRYA